MDATFQITPEMLGLSWRRVLFQALGASFAALLFCVAASKLLYGRFTTGSVVGLVVSIVICNLLMRPLSRTKLRVTNDTIQQSDGPIIRRDEIARVIEHKDGKVPGIEIIGDAKPKWLRDYRIFVPAALPGFEEVKRVVQGWVKPENWHTSMPR